MNRSLNRLVNLILLLLAVFALLALTIESIGCTVEGSLAVWMALLCLSLWLAASFRRGLLIGMPLAALLLYGAWRFYDSDLTLQLADFLDRVTGAYYTHIYAPGSSFVYAESVQSHSLILLFLGFLTAAYLISALTSHGGSLFLAMLGTVPIFFGCLAVNGSPSPLPVVCMLLFWLLLFVGGDNYSAEGHRGRAILIALLPVALLVGAALLFFSPASYQYTQADLENSRRVDELGRTLSQWIGTRSSELAEGAGETVTAVMAAERPEERASFRPVWSTGDELSLTGAYDPSADGEVLLRVRADQSGRLYLRCRSFGDYTGTGWAAAPEAPGMSSLNFAAEAASFSGGTAHTLELRPEVRLGELPLPYYTIWDEPADSYAALGAPERATVDYTSFSGDPGLLQVPAELQAQEQAYRSFAADIYTRLPEQTRAQLLSICASADIAPGSEGLVERVAAYVRARARYDLNTEAYPTEDMAVYFLTEAESGYCVHYATAAAALYRALGVPARVTEGFVVNARDSRFVPVTGADAHAWVEVYAYGIGWLPVEVTGSSAAQQAEPGPAPEEAAPAMAQPEEPAAAQTPEAAPTQSPAPTQDPLPIGWIAEDAQPQGAETLPGWAVLLLALILFLTALPLHCLLLRARRRRRLAQRNRRKAAVAAWQIARKAEVFGAAMPDALRRCAEKAAFSRHDISPEELRGSVAALEELLDETYDALSLPQRLRFLLRLGLR